MAGTEAHEDPSALSLLDPEVQECPYPFYAAVRQQCPVYRLPENGFYLVSTYADLKRVLRDTETFSNAVGLARDEAVGDLMPNVTRMYREQGWLPAATLQRTDPPAHTRYRRPIARTFTARRVETMRDAITTTVDTLIDAFPGSGETDFVSSFAVPLPCGVIADQFGVPQEDVPKLKLWSDALMDSFSMMMTPEREAEVAEELLAFQQYFAGAFESRMLDPKDDMLSDLLRTEAGEQPLSMNELLDMMSQLLTGGNDTTTGSLAEGTLLLATYPDVQRRLRARPELVDNFVEEVLRLESPVQGLMRVTTRDVELGGTLIPQGAVVIARYGSANRDEAHFEDPDRFDAERIDASEHLAFGMGPHFCPGAMLARAEMQIAFRRLLARLDGIELAVPASSLAHHRSLLHRRLKALPIRYQSVRAAD